MGLPGLAGAVDRDLKSSANLAHPGVGKPAKSAGQDPYRDAFDRVEVDRRTARDRIKTRFKDNLTGQSPDGCRARCDERASKSRYRSVAGQHNDWARVRSLMWVRRVDFQPRT